MRRRTSDYVDLSALRHVASDWDVERRTGDGGLPVVVGTYGGSGGLAAMMTGGPGSRTGEIEALAVGSQLVFEVTGQDRAGSCACVMHLGSVGTKFGLTADAGTFRSYMNDVTKQLRVLDPDARLEKSA